MLSTVLAITALHMSPEETPLEWFEGSFEEARQSAEAEGKLLLTYFWANTPLCQQLYSQTMSDPKVVEQMSGMICFSANVTESAPREVFDFYGLTTIPALMVSDSSGEDLEIMTGFMGPTTFQGEFNRIANGINTIPDLRRRVDGKHASLDAELSVRKMLADKLALMGKQHESTKMLEDIKDMDLKLRTYTVALMRFNELLSELTSAAEDPAEWELAPLAKFIRKLPKKNKRARFDSLVQLASAELAAGAHQRALKTYAEAWKQRPGNYQAIGSATVIVNQLMRFPEPLPSKQLKFARTVALGTLELLAEDHAAHCEKKSCDGRDRSCENYARDLQAVIDGNLSGHFVTGRATTNRAFLEYLVAQTEHANGNSEEAIGLMRLLVAENPANQNFVDTLHGYEHPEEEGRVADSD